MVNRPPIRASARGWCFDRHDGVPWLIFYDGDRLVGARVAHEHGNVLTFDVGGFVVMLPTRSRELFVVPAEGDGADPDAMLAASWAEAGRPEWRSPREQTARTSRRSP